jgi:hypothetical protein
MTVGAYMQALDTANVTGVKNKGLFLKGFKNEHHTDICRATTVFKRQVLQ